MYLKKKIISKPLKSIDNDKRYETNNNSYQKMNHVFKKPVKHKLIKQFRRKAPLKSLIKKSLSRSMLSDSVTSFYTTIETKRSKTRCLEKLSHIIFKTLNYLTGY